MAVGSKRMQLSFSVDVAFDVFTFECVLFVIELPSTIVEGGELILLLFFACSKQNDI